jgi:hypothetical protein
MFGTSTHSYWNEQMLGIVGQVVHEDYHGEFVRTRDPWDPCRDAKVGLNPD